MHGDLCKHLGIDSSTDHPDRYSNLFHMACFFACGALAASISGHRPVNVKRALIGSKGGWKLSTIFLSCKVFHDWSIIKLGSILYLLDGYIFAVLFETTSHCFC